MLESLLRLDIKLYMSRLHLAILLYMHLGLVGFGSPHLIIDDDQTPKGLMLVQLRPPVAFEHQGIVQYFSALRHNLVMGQNHNCVTF
jgi:hypothetical protein